MAARGAEPYDAEHRPPIPGGFSQIDPLNGATQDELDAIKNFGQVLLPPDPISQRYNAEEIHGISRDVFSGDQLVRSGSTNAMDWAEGFVKTVGKLRKPDSALDAGYVVDWFANAIEVAKSAERQKIARGIRGIGLGDASEDAADTRDAIAKMVRDGQV